MIGKMFSKRRFDVCALSETKLKGKGEVIFGEVVGRVSGVAGGRAREIVALLLCGWLMRCVVEWKEVSSRLVWVRVKIGRESLVFISAYGPGTEKSEEEIEEFWNELSECVRSFGRSESVVVLGDLNARVGNKVTEGIVGRHGVPGRNESGKRLLEICVEQELVVGNSWFKKINVCKYTWLRMAEGRVVDKALKDYVLLPRRMLGRLLDLKMWRGEGGGMSDHFFGGSSTEIGGWLEEFRMDGGCEKCVEGDGTE